MREENCDELGAVRNCYMCSVDSETEEEMLRKLTIDLVVEKGIVINILRLEIAYFTVSYAMYLLLRKSLRRTGEAR